MYDKCYFCLDQLPKLKKESTTSFFVNFGRSRGTKEPTYITVHSDESKPGSWFCNWHSLRTTSLAVSGTPLPDNVWGEMTSYHLRPFINDEIKTNHAVWSIWQYLGRRPSLRTNNIWIPREGHLKLNLKHTIRVFNPKLCNFNAFFQRRLGW